MRRSGRVVVVTLLALAAAFAWACTTPSSASRSLMEPTNRRVIVKIRSGLRSPAPAVENETNAFPAYLWESLKIKFAGIQISTREAMQALIAKIRSYDPSYDTTDLERYYALVPSDKSQLSELQSFLTTNFRGVIEFAYIEPSPRRPPSIDPSNDPWSSKENYLDECPGGVDARYAWCFRGGDGSSSAGLVDLESGWTTDHEDLKDHKIRPVPTGGVNHGEFPHGTSVLGVIAASVNAKGAVGIAPNAKNIRWVSQWQTDNGGSTAEAIVSALLDMKPYEILLLEAQTDYDSVSCLPVEVEPFVQALLRAGAALDVFIVEAAGNGGHPLDTIQGASFDAWRSIDSAALLVGAAKADCPHSALGFSNYGGRIGTHAWGQMVATLDTDALGKKRDGYTCYFMGTSSASAIIAGVAVTVQSLAIANLGQGLKPALLREILSDARNAAEPNADLSQGIGVMPCLRKIIDRDSRFSGKVVREREPRPTPATTTCPTPVCKPPDGLTSGC